MGSKHNSCLCPIHNNAQEAIDTIFISTKLSETSLEQNIAKVLECVNRIEQKQISPDYSFIITDCLTDYDFLNKNFNVARFNVYLNSILNNKHLFQAQQLYFNKILEKHDATQTCFSTIITLVIMLSKTAFVDKVEILHQHITQFYGKTEKDIIRFLADIINLNTDDCIYGFYPFLTNSEIMTLTKVFSLTRKERLLKHILRNYNDKNNLQLTRSIITTRERRESIDETKELDNSKIEEKLAKTRRSKVIHDSEKIINLSNEDEDHKKIYTFLCNRMNELNGEFVRNWLYEDYCQEKNISKNAGSCVYYINL